MSGAVQVLERQLPLLHLPRGQREEVLLPHQGPVQVGAADQEHQALDLIPNLKAGK